MKNKENEKYLALLYAYWAAIETLIEDGILDRDRFFARAASGAMMLSQTGNKGALKALNDIIDPIAASFPPTGKKRPDEMPNPPAASGSA